MENLSKENIDILERIKKSIIEEVSTKYEFELTDTTTAAANSYIANSVYNSFCKGLEEQKKKNPNKIIYDENGNSCYLKDLKVVNYEINDNILYVSLEGKSEYPKIIDINILPKEDK